MLFFVCVFFFCLCWPFWATVESRLTAHKRTLELLSSTQTNQAFDTELTYIWPRVESKEESVYKRLIHRDPLLRLKLKSTALSVGRVEFNMKVFRFVICSLVIYGCFEGDVAKIEADNTALEKKTNKVGGEQNNIGILDEEFPDEPYVEIRTKRETDGD